MLLFIKLQHDDSNFCVCDEFVRSELTSNSLVLRIYSVAHSLLSVVFVYSPNSDRKELPYLFE